jgi:hypothetical protein
VDTWEKRVKGIEIYLIKVIGINQRCALSCTRTYTESLSTQPKASETNKLNQPSSEGKKIGSEQLLQENP